MKILIPGRGFKICSGNNYSATQGLKECDRCDVTFFFLKAE